MWDETLLATESVSARADERVLVVVVPSLRDWDIVQHEHWYRIPVNRAPRQVGADYLAFYHTGRFTNRWTIRQYAPVVGYRVCKRRELLPAELQHPRAEQMYYKVELGDLEELPRPICSPRLRRITFIPTTLERLLRAREINELWEHDTRKDQLARILAIREWLWWRNY